MALGPGTNGRAARHRPDLRLSPPSSAAAKVRATSRCPSVLGWKPSSLVSPARSSLLGQVDRDGALPLDDPGDRGVELGHRPPHLGRAGHQRQHAVDPADLGAGQAGAVRRQLVQRRHVADQHLGPAAAPQGVDQAAELGLVVGDRHQRERVVDRQPDRHQVRAGGQRRLQLGRQRVPDGRPGHPDVDQLGTRQGGVAQHPRPGLGGRVVGADAHRLARADGDVDARLGPTATAGRRRPRCPARTRARGEGQHGARAAQQAARVTPLPVARIRRP